MPQPEPSRSPRPRRTGLASSPDDVRATPWKLAREERRRTRAALQKEGITWIPLRYHKKPVLLSTLFDIQIGVWRGVRFARRTEGRLVHARGSVAGAIGYVTSRITGGLLLADADGPLSQEYVDAGVWKKGSMAHRLTAAVEGNFMRTADLLVVLTEHRRAEVAPLARAEVVVLPCAVDLDLFARDPEGPRLRQKLGLRGTVFAYAGKADGWYLTGPMLDFVQVAREVLGEVALLVLTTKDPRVFRQRAQDRGLACVVLRAAREEMPRFLSAADVGLSFRLNAPSQRACSPVKNGEYLACGLPIVSTMGIGDYSDLVVRSRVGVVVEELGPEGYRRSAKDLRDLLRDTEIRERCRQVARGVLGLREVVIPRYCRIYELLLGCRSGHRA